jgi:cardiolipin synthase
MVVDAETAFTGGMGIDDRFFKPRAEPEWRESMVQVNGKVVAAMQEAFAEAWSGVGPRECERDAAPAPLKIDGMANARLILSTPFQPRGEALFLSAILGAQTSVFITNPFVIPSARISVALTKAARSGIDVRLIVPGRHNRFAWTRDAMRGFYTPFMRAGVKLFEYEAAMLHAKTIVVDDRWAAVGSFNLDAQSLVFNDEIAVAACDGGLAREVAAGFDDDCANARAIRLESWQNRGLVARAREGAASLLRGLL